MANAVWHELGPASGTCTVCGADGALTLGEARFTRNLLERLRREYCSPPARFVTCRDCGWRWSVRADDRSADGVRHRTGTARRDDDAPQVPAARAPQEQPQLRQEPQPAALTVLPHQRPGRDWAYSRR